MTLQSRLTQTVADLRCQFSQFQAILDAIRAETVAELARIEEHGGEAGFGLRILAILEEGETHDHPKSD